MMPAAAADTACSGTLTGFQSMDPGPRNRILCLQAPWYYQQCSAYCVQSTVSPKTQLRCLSIACQLAPNDISVADASIPKRGSRLKGVDTSIESLGALGQMEVSDISPRRTSTFLCLLVPLSRPPPLPCLSRRNAILYPFTEWIQYMLTVIVTPGATSNAQHAVHSLKYHRRHSYKCVFAECARG